MADSAHPTYAPPSPPEQAPPPPPLPARPPPPYVLNAADDVNHDRANRSNNSSSERLPPSQQSSFQIPRKAVPNARYNPVPVPLEINTSQPEDFEGEIDTNNELPSHETIRKIQNYILLDRDGKTRPFKSLYSGSNVARRVLIIFVRHFFCGNCQEFLRSLSEAVTPDSLLRLPVSTFIAVVGCGDPSLIDMYVTETNCPFPVYTDPTRSLFQALGMTSTHDVGTKPAYMRKSMTRALMDSVGQAIKQIPNGNFLKFGDQRQVGGEFLFEPQDISTPVTTPTEEVANPLGAFDDHAEAVPKYSKYNKPQGDEQKMVTWCHRMKTTRDHAEVHELMEVLGFDPNKVARQIQRQGSAGMASVRKGRGQSMADQMRKLSGDHSAAMI